jgi:hypothetical protein
MRGWSRLLHPITQPNTHNQARPRRISDQRRATTPSKHWHDRAHECRKQAYSHNSFGRGPRLPRVIAPSGIAAEGAYRRPIRHRRWHLSLVQVRKVMRPVDGLATNDGQVRCRACDVGLGACEVITVGHDQISSSSRYLDMPMFLSLTRCCSMLYAYGANPDLGIRTNPRTPGVRM